MFKKVCYLLRNAFMNWSNKLVHKLINHLRLHIWHHHEPYTTITVLTCAQ